MSKNIKQDIFNFIGIGSAFNPDLGNNNVFITNEANIILIDCGGLTFSKLLKLNVLHDKQDINIIITHTHTDHIGSLADLIFYTYYVKNIKPKIYFPDTEFIITFLRCTGVEDDIYEIFDSKNLSIDLVNKSFDVSFIRADHVPNIPCYSLVINYREKRIFYSGDTKNISDTTLEKFKKGEFDYFFQDISGANYPENVHMPFKMLCDVIPKNLRHKVFCMHYDQALNILDVIKEGFNTVEVYNETIY